jgi:CDP-glycerol glycerophosphotransferase
MDGANSDSPSRHSQEPSCPLISFILPTYNAARHLDDCLGAITRQSYRDIEIIAVDGASTDETAAALDEWSRTEPRLTVRRQTERIGPGRARNIGARLAAGQYLWFVDADDVIVAECLTAIAQCLKADAPDVLLVDYEVVPPHGRARRSPIHELGDPSVSQCFTVADRPGVLNLSMSTWNKIVRREFFRSLETGFATEWPHEDVYLSGMLLLDAKRMSMLDQVCYRYTKDGPGSAMRTGDRRRHFKIFGAWRALLESAQIRAKADDPVITSEVYRALFERSIWHYSTLLDSRGFGVSRIGWRGYVTRRDRRDYFGRMHDDFVRYAPSGYKPERGFRGVKFGLIAKGAYGTFAILDPLNQCRNALIRARDWHSRRQPKR